MKAKHIIRISKEIDIDVKGIKLLSVEEYEQYKEHIPHVHFSYWLRSHGDNERVVFTVSEDNERGYGEEFVNTICNVRPVLIISNLKLFKMVPGEEFEFADHIWTVISDDMAICNISIAQHCYNKKLYKHNTNDYETSEIKEFIEEWLESIKMK